MAKLLLVEDSESVWGFLSRRLERRGHQVLMAHDGEAGLAAANASMPDLILLDMNLPLMDGWTVARALKSDAATRAIPIIALTAHAMADDRDKALLAGCDEYHPKPVDFAKLIEQIGQLTQAASSASAVPAAQPAGPTAES